MQAWLFLSGFWNPDRVKSYLSEVPPVRQVCFLSPHAHDLVLQEHMILLDLFSEVRPQYTRFESFYGHFYIWNMLHDFGGNNNLFGSLINVTNVCMYLYELSILRSSFRVHNLLVIFPVNLCLVLV